MKIFQKTVDYLRFCTLIGGMKGKKFNRIKAVLAEQEMSQKELAAILQVAPGTVSTWCRNLKQPEVPTLFKIAWVLKVAPASLISSMAASGFEMSLPDNPAEQAN